MSCGPQGTADPTIGRHTAAPSTYYAANAVRSAGDCGPYLWTVHGHPFYIFYILYTVNAVRSAGDCGPYHWTAHGHSFYIFYILYTVNTPA